MTNLVLSNPALQKLLATGSAQIQNALGGDIPWHEFVMCLDYAVQTKPELAECVEKNPKSVLHALVHCAMLGLRPGPVHSHFALIPYRIKGVLTCRPQVEYRGLIDIAQRAGKLKDVQCELVYRGEDFEYDRAARTIRHVYKIDIDRSDKNIIAAYAIATVDGWDKPIPYVMTRQEIDDTAKERSKAAKRGEGPWLTDFGPMCKKTVLRRLFGSGLIPMNTGAQLRLREQERAEREADAYDEPIDITGATVVTEPEPGEAAEPPPDDNADIAGFIDSAKTAEDLNEAMRVINRDFEKSMLSKEKRAALLQLVHEKGKEIRGKVGTK